MIEHEGRVIGGVALRLTDRAHLAAEIGWVLDPSAGGQGGEWTSTLVYGLLESDR